MRSNRHSLENRLSGNHITTPVDFTFNRTSLFSSSVEKLVRDTKALILFNYLFFILLPTGCQGHIIIVEGVEQSSVSYWLGYLIVIVKQTCKCLSANLYKWDEYRY